MEHRYAMISQGMNGKSDEEIIEIRNKAIKRLESLGYEILNTFYTDDWKIEEDLKNSNIINRGLYFLGRSLMDMGKCKAVYFTKGWEQYRGCIIEHEAAAKYGLDLIYEN